MADRSLELVYAHPELAELEPAARKKAIEELLRSQLGDGAAHEADRIVRNIDGFGPLTDLLTDELVADVLVNGTGEVWIERAGRLERSSVRVERDELYGLVDRLVGTAGGRADPLHPVTDVSLANGDRLHVVMPPIAPDGPLVSIRRFRERGLSLDDLVTSGTVAPCQREALLDLVRDRASIAISGATGTGKTALLGALLSAIGDDERVVIIEETRELRPALPHAVFLTTREANAEGTGIVSSAMLVRAALRMRPDRVVIGEVRGPEAADALWAMSTGHAGSMLTVHARGPRHVPLVLADLAAKVPVADAPQLADRFSDAIDAFVHLERVDGRRVVTALLA